MSTDVASTDTAASRRITLTVGLMMFVDATLYLAVIPLLPYYADRYGFSKTESSALLVAYPVVVPFVSLLGGLLVGRVTARQMAIGSATVTVIATTGFGLADQPLILIGLRGLQGAAAGVLWSALIAWVTRSAPADRRSRATGLVMGMLSAGSVGGPGIGALAAWTGPRTAFLIVAAMALAPLALAISAPEGVSDSSTPNLVRALARVLGQPLMRAAIAIAIIDPLAFAVIDLLVPLELDRAGIEGWGIGVALAVGSVLGIATGPLAGWLAERVGEVRVAMVASSLIALLPALLATGLGVTLQLAVLVVGGPLFAIVATVMYPLAAAGADRIGVSHAVGNGLLGLAWSLSFAGIGLAAGGLADAFGDRTAYAIAAAGTVPLLAMLFATPRTVGVAS